MVTCQTWFQDNDSWFTSKSDIKWQGCWECRCLEWHGELFFWGAAAADDDDDDDDDDGDDDDNSGDDGDGDDDDDDDDDDGNGYDVDDDENDDGDGDDDDDDDDDHRHVDWGITDFQANQYQYNNYLSVFFPGEPSAKKKCVFHCLVVKEDLRAQLRKMETGASDHENLAMPWLRVTDQGSAESPWQTRLKTSANFRMEGL